MDTSERLEEKKKVIDKKKKSFFVFLLKVDLKQCIFCTI